MCTSIVSNGNKTIAGWNLDILDMEYKIVSESDKMYIPNMNQSASLKNEIRGVEEFYKEKEVKNGGKGRV